MDFQKAFQSWFEGAQKIVADYMATNFPNNPKEVLVVRNMNAKYIAIDRHDLVEEKDKVTGEIKLVPSQYGSAHAFIASQDGYTKALGHVSAGDVLKPATYKVPAKHARGNIFNDDNGLGCMGPSGPAYLKN